MEKSFIRLHLLSRLGRTGYDFDHSLRRVLWRVELAIFREKDKLVCAAALVCFLIVVGKCVLEAATGHVVFESWHLGSLGTPIAVCHAGGVLGGFIGLVLFRPSQRA